MSAWRHSIRTLDADAFAEVRRRTMFECCKWDPQVEDVSILSPHVIVLSSDTWLGIAQLAERLDAEVLAAERELQHRTDLHRTLGLPPSIRRALRAASTGQGGSASIPPLRFTRYDFHPTTEGWRISEANTDVPGGFIEGGGFTSLIAQHIADAEPAADPAASLVEAFHVRFAAFSTTPRIGLVHATAYIDDRQVMIHLAQRLEAQGLLGELLAPDQINWHDGAARMIDADGVDRPLDGIIRFFPGEWLANLPRRTGWRCFFGGSHTLLANPATALLTQSKRFPLVWDRLATELSTWRALLPETRDPRQAAQHGLARDESWVYKPAFGRVGDGIGMTGITSQNEWKQIERGVRRHPGHWIAQRRFEAISCDTEDGPRFPLLGVFVIDGRAAGIYGRLGATPLINHLAKDVAVLIDRPRSVGRTVRKEGLHAHESVSMV